MRALYAETIGLNSAWIGEHHLTFSVNASPGDPGPACRRHDQAAAGARVTLLR